MFDQYKKSQVIIAFLDKLGLSAIDTGEAVCDKNYKKAYRIIATNPQITKKQFLKRMKITEFKYLALDRKAKNVMSIKTKD